MFELLLFSRKDSASLISLSLLWWILHNVLNSNCKFSRRQWEVIFLNIDDLWRRCWACAESARRFGDSPTPHPGGMARTLQAEPRTPSPRQGGRGHQREPISPFSFNWIVIKSQGTQPTVIKFPELKLVSSQQYWEGWGKMEEKNLPKL